MSRTKIRRETQNNEETKRELTAEELKKKRLYDLMDWGVYLLIVGVLAFLLLGYVAQRTLVDGTSMNPTLQDKDSVLVEKLSYRFGEPDRYDIVVFRYLQQDNTYYIKRIIGLPGETVQIIDGYVYINGERLADDIYGNDVMLSAGRASEPITLGKYEYFVLGDNRNGSSDSRADSVGNVTKSQIVGKAFLRIWPLTDIGFLKHR